MKLERKKRSAQDNVSVRMIHDMGRFFYVVRKQDSYTTTTKNSRALGVLKGNKKEVNVHVYETDYLLQRLNNLQVVCFIS